MRGRTITGFFAASFLGLSLCGCSNTVEQTAMVLVEESGEILFVDQVTESLYYPTLPEGKVIDEKGEETTLHEGDLVKVYGDGIMLESFPGQYPGIKKVQVEKRGTSEDAEKYADVMEEIYPDQIAEGEHPYGYVEYTTESGDITAALTVVESGEVYNDIALSEPVDVTVGFDRQPDTVTVYKISEETPGDMGNEVEVKSDVFQAEAGYIYKITAVFGNETVEYAIKTR